jgi:hypothetical protein
MQSSCRFGLATDLACPPRADDSRFARFIGRNYKGTGKNYTQDAEPGPNPPEL